MYGSEGLKQQKLFDAFEQALSDTVELRTAMFSPEAILLGASQSPREARCYGVSSFPPASPESSFYHSSYFGGSDAYANLGQHSAVQREYSVRAFVHLKFARRRTRNEGGSPLLSKC